MPRLRYAVLFAILLLPTLCLAENWPGWRGLRRNGLSSETAPVKWTAKKGVRWTAKLPGSGISSPIIWRDQVFVTASDGSKQSELHLICLNRKTGKTQWHRRFWGTAPTRYHSTKSSMASPTPVTDGRHVYAFYGTGDVFCVSVSGELQWSRSLASEYGRFENRFSATSSPLLLGNQLILQCDHYGDSYLLSIDKRTGANQWKKDRPGYWLSWSSPVLVKNERGEQELVVSGSQRLNALDPSNGESLWSVSGMRRECIPTPVVFGGIVYAVSGPKGPSMAIRPGGRGDVSESRVIWRNTRGAPFVPSAIVAGNQYFLVDDSGVATCLDLKNGKRIWQKRLPGRYTASPIAAAGRVYFCNESGETIVLKAGAKEFTRLARNKLGEPIFASPAISQENLYIRTPRNLYCLGK